MFRFSNPEFLYLLGIIPVLIIILIAGSKIAKKRIQNFGNPELVLQLIPDLSRRKPVFKNILQITAITICIFMIAGPQFGSKIEKVKRQGSEIMIAMDVSNSMLSRDITPNRLEKLKQLVSKIVDKLQDDKIGLVIFAGEAFTQLPITSDFVSAKVFMSTISPDLVKAQGTSIGSAIDLCVRSFGPKGQAERAIIVITDGENFEDNAVESAKNAVEQGIKIHVVGMGTEQGGPIPVSEGSSDFRKDKDQNVVITKLNEKMCQEIAGSGKGLYIRSDNANSALKALSKEIDKMTKADLESSVYSEYDEQFQGLAWIILFLLLFDSFILERKNEIFKKFKLF